MAIAAPWLRLFAVAATAWRYARGDGNPLCPCATPQQLSNRTVAGYGVGCAQHELRLLATGATNVPFKVASCSGPSPPSWCQASWCYVNTQNCSLLYDFDREPPRLAYSYVTCGYLDLFQNWWSAAMSLQNQTIRVVEMSNVGGYLGSYCQASGCTGPSYKFWSQVLANSGVNVRALARFFVRTWPNKSLPLPPTVMRQFSADYPTLQGNSLHWGCFYMTGMGFADLCTDVATVSADRMAITNMIPLFESKILLVTRLTGRAADLDSYVASAFSPFNDDAWITIAAVVTAFGIISALQEQFGKPLGLRPHSWQEAKEIIGNIAYFVYENWMAFLTGGRSAYDFQTLGARLTVAGLAGFALMVVAAYTANLVTGLVAARQAKTEVGSMDEVLKGGIPICAIGSIKRALVSTLNVQDSQIYQVASATDVLKFVKDGTQCRVAAHKEEDWLGDRNAGGIACEFKAVELVLTVSQGAAVSARALRGLQSQAQSLSDSGFWERLSSEATPQDSCGTTADRDDGKLGVEELAGPIVLGIALTVAGLALNFLQWAFWLTYGRRSMGKEVAKVEYNAPPDGDRGNGDGPRKLVGTLVSNMPATPPEPLHHRNAPGITM